MEKINLGIIGDYILYDNHLLKNKIHNSLHYDVIPNEENLISLSKGHNAIMTRGKLTSNVIGHFKSNGVRVVSFLSSGTDSLMIDEFNKAGILVYNSPGYSTNSIAEGVVGTMIWGSRRLFIKPSSPFQSLEIFKEFKGNTLKESNIGFIGLGNIGQAIIKYLYKGFGVNKFYGCVSDVSKKRNIPKNTQISFVSMKELASKCDIFVVCCDLNDSTYKFINGESFFRYLKDGVVLTNISRSDVIDYDDLQKYLAENKNSFCFTDDAESYCRANEKFFSDCELPNLLITPHIMFNTNEALYSCGNMGIRNISNFFRGVYKNCLNAPK